MKKKAEIIVEHLKEELFSAANCAKYKKRVCDLSRNRVLSFAHVVVLILSGHKLSLQHALNKFFSLLGEVFHVPTAAAYCQAKQKVKPEVFAHLSAVVCDDFYRLDEREGQVRLWHGHRLLGADGRYLNLPDTASLRATFGVHENQPRKEENQRVQALAVLVHDLGNDLVTGGALASSHSSEKGLLLGELWGATVEGDVLVLDRNSADYTIIARASKEGREVVIRCPRQSFSVVHQFWHSTWRERIVPAGRGSTAKNRRVAAFVPRSPTRDSARRYRNRPEYSWQ